MLKRILFFLMVFSISIFSAFCAAEITQYEEEINLPACNESDPDVLFIRSVDDWKKINDTQYKVFCVLPGDYRSAGVIDLRVSGTAEDKRWIRWYDPDNPNDNSTHPVNMITSKQAVVKQIFVGGINTPSTANHWVIDRLVIRGSEFSNRIDHGSSDNIFNRVLIEEGESTYFVFGTCKRNVLQNSILRNAKMVPGSDRSLIYFSENEDDRVVNNELYNATASCVQQGPESLSGNIVYGNNCYVTPAYYSDCNGHLDPSGECAACEMGVVVKGPPVSAKPMLIANNIFWGFRSTDTALAATGSPGNAIDIGSGGGGVSNVIVENNIIYDVPNAIYLGADISQIQIVNNLIYDIHDRDQTGSAISNTYGKNIKIQGNTIINAEYWYRGSYLNESLDMQNNIIIDCPDVYVMNTLPVTAIVKDNYIYNSKILTSISTHSEFIYPLVEDSKNVDRCIEIKSLTLKAMKCIPYGQSTIESPHDKSVKAPINLKIRPE
ncbi:right-handed parallel beta-helix repeat-containing protein [Candidatus Pacearchaeota archaeon]|nr:right-handed parallel beta-helix repeat-containing protein [Candidatus Pacearchaeota archaeon]